MRATPGPARRTRGAVGWSRGTACATAVAVVVLGLVARAPVGAAALRRNPGPCPAASSRAAAGEAMGVAAMTSEAGCPGYWVVTGSGAVAAFGAAAWHGDLGSSHLVAPVTAIAATHDGGGYWVLGGDGHVWAFGDATFFGDGSGRDIPGPWVSITPTADDRGYWILSQAGRVLGFGAAPGLGGIAGGRGPHAAVGIAATPRGLGYWVADSAGRVEAFGSAGVDAGRLAGGAATAASPAPVVGLVAASVGAGYWLVDAAGGVRGFGAASPPGPLAGGYVGGRTVAIAARTNGNGYWLLADNGTVGAAGAAPLGDLVETDPLPVLQLASLPWATTEVVTVEGTTPTRARLATWELGVYGWRAAFAAMPARTGYGGWLPVGRRRPGDGATPIGIFAFGPTMYGNRSKPAGVSYPFHHLVCGDWWNEDPSYVGDGYNSFEHVPCGDDPGFGPDSEALWTEVAPYPWFATISTPSDQPTGAGIFLHAATHSSTAGCVSLLVPALLQVLRWLRPSAHPTIVMGPSEASLLTY